MTLNDKCTIQRALGIIKGAAWGMDSPYAEAITTAAEMIDEVIGKEESNEAT